MARRRVPVGLNGAFAPAGLIAALVFEVHARDPVTGERPVV